MAYILALQLRTRAHTQLMISFIRTSIKVNGERSSCLSNAVTLDVQCYLSYLFHFMLSSIFGFSLLFLYECAMIKSKLGREGLT